MIRYRIAITVIAVAASILLACGGDRDDGPTGSPGDQTPAATATPPEGFILYRDGLGDLVALDLQSGDSYVHAIDFTSEVILAAECTADGSRIAFLRQDFEQTDRELLIVGAAAEERFALPPGTQGISWSPDASQIAYVVYVPTTGYSISSLDLATGESTMQVRGIGIAGGVRWSPAGDRIAFQAPMATISEIWVYELDSAVLRPTQVTQGQGAFDPEWTPDGDSLLVSALTEDETYEIFDLDPDTGEVTQITSSADIFKRLPRFSPDGDTIAYTGSIVVPTVSRFADSLHSFGVFLMNADGSNERALTADPRLNPGQGVDPFLDALLIGWCRPGPWLDDTWALRDPQASPVTQ